MRSLLLISVEAGNTLPDAAVSQADAVILCDIERAEAQIASIRERARTRVYVRIDPLRSPRLDAYLTLVASVAPDGVLLPEAGGGPDVLCLSAMLGAREAMAGLADGAIGIVPILDTAEGLLDPGSWRNAGARLQGIAWDAAALATALGARSARDPQGRLIDPCRWARSVCLVAATIAGVPAFDTPYRMPVDPAAFAAEAQDAHDFGFAGKMVDGADQIAVTNELYGRNG